MLLQKFIFPPGCRNCFLYIFILCSNTLWAQNKPAASYNRTIDSLLKVLKSSGEDTLKAKTLNALAWQELCLAWFFAKKNDDVILKYANEANKLATKWNNKYQQGIALNIIAHVFKNQGKYPEALTKFFAVIKLSEEIGDMSCVANQYKNIGDVYLLQNDLPKSINSHLTAINIAKTSGDKRFVLQTLNGMANMYLKSLFNEEAIKYFKQAVEVAKEINDKYYIGSGNLSLGNTNKIIGNSSEARKNYLESLNYLNPDEKRAADAYMGLGWVTFLEGVTGKTANPKQNYSDAFEYFQKALHVARLIRDNWYIEESYIGIAATYKKLNDYEKALYYTTLRYQFKDSVSKKEALDKLSTVKSKYKQEKILIEYQAQQKVFMAKEMAIREKMLNEQKFQQGIELANEKNLREKTIAEQKFEQEKKITREKAKYDKSLALEKSAKEKLKAEQQQKNILIMSGTGAILIITIFLFLYLRQRSAKKRAVEKAQAIHKMAELEMQSLRSQLNPHFMFNSLNSIQELILMEENEKSHSYLSRFGKLLRVLLENAEKPFIPIRKEIDFLELYLALENLRIPDLQYSISTDPKLNIEGMFIPNMILQPYIENAIWHGLSHKEKDKQLQIRIYRQNGTVNYEIEDNGVGRKKSEELKSLFRQKHQSKGTELLSKRFKLLNEEYSSDINTITTDVIKNNEVAGTLVTIKVPVKLSQSLLN